MTISVATTENLKEFFMLTCTFVSKVVLFQWLYASYSLGSAIHRLDNAKMV